MDLRQSLARSFAARHPNEAAAALEAQPPEEIAPVLEALSPAAAGPLLKRMSLAVAARSIEHIDPSSAAMVTARLDIEDAVVLLRAVSVEHREAIIREMPAERADTVAAVLHFKPGTAGALMDPRVVALPVDLDVEEALKLVRRDASHVHYTLFAIDRERRLAGVLGLQDLLLARPGDTVKSIARTALHWLSPTATRHAIIANPGWRDAYALPVVDAGGRLVGALDYPVLRALEDEIDTMGGGGDTAARALGDLLWTGMGGMIDALAAAVVSPRPQPARRTAPPPGGGDEPGDRGEGWER